MFYSAVPLNAMGAAQPCPVPSLSPFIRSICPCLRVPLVISPGCHVSPLAHCLVFWCESASCAPAFIHQTSWRWRDEHKQRERETLCEVRAKSLSFLSSFFPECLYLVSLNFELFVVSINPLSAVSRAVYMTVYAGTPVSADTNDLLVLNSMPLRVYFPHTFPTLNT